MITEQGLARVRGVLRRRKLPIVAVGAAAVAVGALVIGRLETRYRASAVVRALESQPAREYVAPTVAEQVGERLRTLRLAIMSRPLILGVVDELKIAEADTREETVERVRGRIKVKVEGEDTFLVTYDDTDPARAQAVVNAVARRFIDTQVERRREVASATVRALADEADKLRPEVERLEAKVRQFKLERYGSLPEQQEQNMRMLDQATMELNIQATNLDFENERRRQLIAAAISPLRRQEEHLQTALHDVRTRYLADHPEVKRVAAELDETRAARKAEERELRRSAREHNPELVALEGEIRRTSGTIAGLRERQAGLRARLADTAKNGQELAKLQADHDAAAAKYVTLTSRLREAELASGLERNLAGLRYDLVEGALLPGVAVFPDRPFLALVAVVVALGLALGVGFALDRLDSRIYAPAELVALGRPVELLACVPEISGALSYQERKTLDGHGA